MTPERFNPYDFLGRVETGEFGEDRIMLSDQFQATDLQDMLKTALIAVQILSHKVAQIEAGKGDPK